MFALKALGMNPCLFLAAGGCQPSLAFPGLTFHHSSLFNFRFHMAIFPLYMSLCCCLLFIRTLVIGLVPILTQYDIILATSTKTLIPNKATFSLSLSLFFPTVLSYNSHNFNF